MFIAIDSGEERSMESLLFELLEYGAGAVIGFSLGVLAMALVRATNADNLPLPGPLHVPRR